MLPQWVGMATFGLISLISSAAFCFGGSVFHSAGMTVPVLLDRRFPGTGLFSWKSGISLVFVKAIYSQSMIDCTFLFLLPRSSSVETTPYTPHFSGMRAKMIESLESPSLHASLYSDSYGAVSIEPKKSVNHIL